MVHAKDWGALGTFTVIHDITKSTKASIFASIGKVTPMICRFSTVAGAMGAADNEHDMRGFALKFDTDEGNWDVVGNNAPVFFLRDPNKFPDVIPPETPPQNQPALWGIMTKSARPMAMAFAPLFWPKPQDSPNNRPARADGRAD